MASFKPGENPNDENFWTTNPGWERDIKSFWEKFTRRVGIKFPFVEAKPLPGINRWVLRWRFDPSPAGWIMTQFMSGTTKTIQRYARQKNAELERAHKARMARKRNKKKEEEHLRAPKTGPHTSGPWWDCPACNRDSGKEKT